MSRTLMLGFFTAILLITSYAVKASEQNIDPANDIIVGAKDAPHEMVIYFSPGCIHCMKLYAETYEKIKNHMDAKELRVVFREIPNIVPFKRDEDGELTTMRKAMSDSFVYSLMLRCNAKYNDGAAYADTFMTLSDTVLNTQMTIKEDGIVWPYLDKETLTGIAKIAGENDAITSEQLGTCLSDPLKTEFTESFKRNLEIFSKTLKQTELPSYYIDGKMVEFENKDNTQALMQALNDTFK